jgi:alanine dehydrogenase
VPGVEPARVLVIGGGVVGTQRGKRMAMGLGADVTIVDRSITRLKELDDAVRRANENPLYSTREAITAELVESADMVIGAVLIPGAAAPKLVRRDQLKDMKPGAVVVDVAIDQGGCFETSHATTHEDP